MDVSPDRQLDALCKQLNEHVVAAAECANEIERMVRRACELDQKTSTYGPHARKDGAAANDRPLLDESTLSVLWNGAVLPLGHTRGFWLLSRLTRSANQYVTHADLLEEIWDDEFTETATLRAGVQRLRKKLRGGGMSDLANAIVGHHGRYMLDLKTLPRCANVTAMSH